MYFYLKLCLKMLKVVFENYINVCCIFVVKGGFFVFDKKEKEVERFFL